MKRFELLWDSSVNESVRELLEPFITALALLTHLGDGAVLLVLGVLIYWFGALESRRDRAFVIAVGVAALALSAGMKGVVQLPRPEVAFAPAGYPGYSFPSAHAMGSAAFYGALAVTMEWGTRRRRYLLAGSVITIVALSRVVIGVHYPGDVVVGVLFGLGLVWIGVWTRKEGLFEPGPMFALAVVIAGLAVVLGSRVFVSLTLGASIGGLIGWHYVKDRPATQSGAAVLVLGVVAVVGIASLRVVSFQLGLTAPGGTISPVVFLAEVVGYAVLTVAVLVLPWLAIAVEDSPVVRQLQSRLPFANRTIDGAPDDD
ncbi:phosphatase PAP2 family protein [Natrarchaeobaculum sulfurireducens]|uniref:Membrane-associated phospholipid phosphatase n=1 Tax=Natrarchaeobaculum sulfurireducens TaxID=2044521 RepID=A0A346PAF2_9EURY|nr:phosphatase PAP2 family protein [Natrarchaeobaculum sulfurireducens]AXR76497.1 Membrane-associated phospholipid phosphatase [Natrarchaeobaculum sulfurireducens]AXR80173.1 Membrane-associated phospholipid phosphatase [Natrarchaeobaculum sulfurireducens]